MWVDESRQGQSSGFRGRFSDQAVCRTVQHRGWTMTNGTMGNDESLLTEQDVRWSTGSMQAGVPPTRTGSRA